MDRKTSESDMGGRKKSSGSGGGGGSASSASTNQNTPNLPHGLTSEPNLAELFGKQSIHSFLQLLASPTISVCIGSRIGLG